jgi:hypothetical protein
LQCTLENYIYSSGAFAAGLVLHLADRLHQAPCQRMPQRLAIKSPESDH